MENRIYIIVGHYGSGKTEFSINFALRLAKTYERVYLVDADIVNPYFRSNDAKEQLAGTGVTVIASEYASSNVDMPTLPAEILRVFEDQKAAVVFDVGGDDDGAVALGRFKQNFDNAGYEMYLVVNACRPMSADAAAVEEMCAGIEAASRLSVTGLINNTNIAQLTTAETLLEGQKIVEQACLETGKKLQFISGMKAVTDGLPEQYRDQIFEIERFMALDF